MPTQTALRNDASAESSNSSYASPHAIGESSNGSTSRSPLQSAAATRTPPRQMQRDADSRLSPASEGLRKSPFRRSSGFLLDEPGVHMKKRERKSAERHYGSLRGNTSKRLGTARLEESTPSSAKGKAKSHASLRQESDDAGEHLGSEYPESTGRASRSEDLDRESGQNDGSRVSRDFNEESADIVNLALSLSESRRRWVQVSGSHDPNSRLKQSQSLSPHIPPNIVNRVASTSTQWKDRSTSGTYLRNGTARNSDGSTKNVDSTLETLGFELNRGSFAPAISLLGHSSPTNSTIVPSEATMHRVQRARTTLELSYQYRRLLQYLPEYPDAPRRPATARSRTGKPELGRVYNPLQYIRNRRARFRHECPLDPESRGWNNIEMVEDWIDTVAMAHENLSKAQDDPPNLPPFPGPNQNHGLGLLDNSAVGTDSSALSKRSKPGRPRSDWETNPWSMLADAYWISNAENMSILSDHYDTSFSPSGPREKPRNLRHGSGTTSSKAPPTSYHLSEKPSVAPEKRSDSFEIFRHHLEPAIERVRADHTREAAQGSLADRRGKWSRKMLRSPSVSSSDESVPSAARRTRLHQRTESQVLQQRALLDRQLRDFQAKEDLDATEYDSSTGNRNPMLSGPANSSNSINSRGLKSGKGATGGQQLTLQDPHRMSGTDEAFDTTAPNSPDNLDIIPNITINLTPPLADVDGSRKHKELPQRSILAEMSNASAGVSRTDFALSKPNGQEAEMQADSPRSSLQLIRGMNHILSTSRSNQTGTHRPTRSIDSLYRQRPGSSDSGSRLRGLFRGAKIAELVASPVTKVSDLFWHHEEDGLDSDGASAYDSVPQSIASIPEEGEDPKGISRASSEESLQSFTSTPAYHLRNLPVFRSPFAAGRLGSSNSTQDNLSQVEGGSPRQSLERTRTGGRSIAADKDRPARLASPTRFTKPSKAFEPPLSPVQSLNRPPTTDAFVDAEEQLKDPSSPQYPKIVSPDRHRWTSADSLHHAFDKDLYRPNATVTLRRIARLKVVHMSCTIRANEIARRASSRLENLNPETQRLHELTKSHTAPIAEHEQQLANCRLLINAIDQSFTSIRDAANNFSSQAVANLHEQLRSLHYQISDDLTQMARSAEQGADELNARLATDYTMDIKRLNEKIELIMRRRRRRLRWLRRAAFAALEWMVVAFMWAAWLLVVLVLLVRGCFRGLIGVTRWILWL